MKNIHKIKDNIYITSDEEIKRGDWKLDTFHNQISKVTNINSISKYDKKIILTTDQDLIKDDVQKIDDEFLEWFVKNPSCEWVEVVYGVIRLTENDNKGYWISIPNAEFNMSIEEPKQETLEEVAENYGWRIKRNTFSDAVKANELAESAKQDFIAGAEWMQERMYNEEEVIAFGEFIFKHSLLTHIKGVKSLFERFKKK